VYTYIQDGYHIKVIRIARSIIEVSCTQLK